MEEHQSSTTDMGIEEKGLEMAIANSLVEIQKLVSETLISVGSVSFSFVNIKLTQEAQKQNQQLLLAEHFKNTLAIMEPAVRKFALKVVFHVNANT